MWMPTHVQVTVQRATGLLTKGKNNTNDCFVTIALGKTKYQTSVKEKAQSGVEWHEECELPIPDQGNTAEIVLTALHRNILGVDEFLGRVAIPLNSLDIYERPKNRWYPLQSKPGKEGKAKERGQLEVKIGFTVKSGSLTSLNKKEKHKSSVGQLSQMAHSVGGSLLSIGSAEKRKGIKKFAKSIGSKIHLKSKKKDGGEGDDSSSIGSIGSLKRRNDSFESQFSSKQTKEDADPGVVSEDEDEFTFDDLSHKSSGSSLNQPPPQLSSVAKPKAESVESLSNSEASRRNTIAVLPPAKPPRTDQKPQDEWESKLFGKQTKFLKPNRNDSFNRRSWDSSKLSSQLEEEETIDSDHNDSKEETMSINSNKSPETKKKDDKDGMFSKFRNFRKDKNDLETKTDKHSIERVIIGGENEEKVVHTNNRISNELLQKFEGKSREDMILIACELQSDLDFHKKRLKDLEDYLDDLLLRVMETTPRILQNPYVNCKLSRKNVM